MTQRRGKRASAPEKVEYALRCGARIPQGLRRPGHGTAAMSKAMPSARATATAAARFKRTAITRPYHRVAGNRMCFMRVGTKSVLFGAHCFFIHPFFVAFGWWALGQFPWDPRLWAAFFLHDLGYLFSPNMDGPEGEEHVHFGAKIMGLLFGDWWADFTVRHSRYWAKRNGVSVSKLCYADKLAFAMTPGWLYLPMARATGELAEYMAKSRDRQAGCVAFTETERIKLESGHPAQWLEGLQSYTRRWVVEHQGGGPDTWTVVGNSNAA